MENQIILELLKQLNSKSNLYPAIFGAIGVISGSLITISGQFLIEFIKNRRSLKINNERKRILKIMLESEKYKWREIETLSKVIGANKEETRNLLIQIKARGSSDTSAFNELWGLISRNPLNDITE